ncbi:MAG: ankyrin repeat domain-containing protein, partial [Chlamydiota bacterium]
IYVSLKDDYGKTALEYARQHRHQDAITCLNILYQGRKIVERKPLDEETKKQWWKAVENGYENTVKHILAHYNVDVNAKMGGWPPLHYAAFYNSKEVAKILLQHGADVNAKNEDGETPLHYAAFYNNKEVADLLINAGADKNIKDNDNQTPLDLARKEGHKEMIDLLESKNIL